MLLFCLVLEPDITGQVATRKDRHGVEGQGQGVAPDNGPEATSVSHLLQASHAVMLVSCRRSWHPSSWSYTWNPRRSVGPDLNPQVKHWCTRARGARDPHHACSAAETRAPHWSSPHDRWDQGFTSSPRSPGRSHLTRVNLQLSREGASEKHGPTFGTQQEPLGAAVWHWRPSTRHPHALIFQGDFGLQHWTENPS